MPAQSLLLVGPEQLTWTDCHLGEPGPDEILVSTLAGAVSIGIELPHYLGTSRGITKAYPAMTGYESIARVLACGSEVDTIKPGDRIFSFYGHRTHAIIPTSKAIPVPDDVDDEIALFSILSCDVAKGIRALSPAPDDPVLITGASTIGLLTLWILLRYGVRHVDICEPRPNRRDLAGRVGARSAVAPVEQSRIATNYACGFECSSRDTAFGLLQQTIRPGGSICVLADGNLEPLTLQPAFHQKELRIVGSSDGWDYQAHARWFFAQPRDRLDILRQLFEWHINASEFPDAFNRLAHGAESPIEVFVRCPQAHSLSAPYAGAYPLTS
jgi:alcohol dehydrogenase